MAHSQVPVSKFEKIMQLLSAHPTNPYHIENVNAKRRAALSGADTGIPQSNIDALLKWGELADGGSDVMQKLKSVVTSFLLESYQRVDRIVKGIQFGSQDCF